VRVALGSDVGAGTGLSLFKEGLQAFFVQQALGSDGVPLTATHLLHLATMAGAAALDLASEVGSFDLGKAFDALWLRPRTSTPLDILLRYAESPQDALAKAFAHATSADVAQVWVGGTVVSADQWHPPV
jgi:guanine deaminase